MAASLMQSFTGQIYALNLTNSLHTPVQVTGSPTVVNLVNTGVTAAAVMITKTSSPPQALTRPVDGTPSGAPAILLPGNMNWPMTVPVPQGGFWIHGISVSSGTTVVYAVPGDIQS